MCHSEHIHAIQLAGLAASRSHTKKQTCTQLRDRYDHHTFFIKKKPPPFYLHCISRLPPAHRNSGATRAALPQRNPQAHNICNRPENEQAKTKVPRPLMAIAASISARHLPHIGHRRLQSATPNNFGITAGGLISRYRTGTCIDQQPEFE